MTTSDNLHSQQFYQHQLLGYGPVDNGYKPSSNMAYKAVSSDKDKKEAGVSKGKSSESSQPWLNYKKEEIDVGGIPIDVEELNELHSWISGKQSNVDDNDDKANKRGILTPVMDSPTNKKLDPSIPQWVRPYLDHIRTK